MRRRSFLLALAAVPAQAGARTPRVWQVVPARSSIRFQYVLDGEPAEGRFTDFGGRGRFDADRPAAARFTLEVESVSIDLGNRLVSAYATSSEWFDAKHHPVIRYRLLGLAPRGGNEYTATGDITIKGRTERLETGLKLVIGDEEARAEGSLGLSRRRFGLGTEISDLLVEIGDRVTVRFDLVARRV